MQSPYDNNNANNDNEINNQKSPELINNNEKSKKDEEKLKKWVVDRKPITDEHFQIFVNKIADITNIQFDLYSTLNLIFCRCLKRNNLH